MKKTKLFIAIGTLLLSGVAVFATKPKKKFICFRVHFGLTLGCGGTHLTANVTASHFTTVKGTHNTVFLMTDGGNLKATMLTNTLGTQRVYYK